jgi:hypothetical protein
MLSSDAVEPRRQANHWMWFLHINLNTRSLQITTYD